MREHIDRKSSAVEMPDSIENNRQEILDVTAELSYAYPKS